MMSTPVNPHFKPELLKELGIAWSDATRVQYVCTLEDRAKSGGLGQAVRMNPEPAVKKNAGLANLHQDCFYN